MRGGEAERRLWCCGLVSGKQGKACCPWLLAEGWKIELTPQRKADGDWASENNPDSSSLAPERVQSGNSRPVGIWDTSLVVFCRKENHTLLLGSMEKKKKQVFLLTLRFSCLLPNLKKEI